MSVGLEPDLHPALGVPTPAWFQEHQEEFRWSDAMLASMDFVDGIVAGSSQVASDSNAARGVALLRELGWLSAN